MNQEQVTALLIKYKNGELSLDEMALLETWYIKESATDKPKLTEEEIDMISQRVRLMLPLTEQEPLKLKLWPRITAAAVAIMIVGAGLFYVNTKISDKNEQLNSSQATTIVPGKQSATLTLANGKKIRLTEKMNGKVANEAGITITKTKSGQLIYSLNADEKNPAGLAGDGQTNILSTAKGETYQLRLPDGSAVWLNAASKLIYMAALNEHGIRRVKLEGEAYFQVAKDRLHPFVVESGRQQIQVLGTTFNVNTYTDEAVIKTTLLEGSIRLSENGISKILMPGNQAVNASGAISIHPANTSLAVAWKDNNFIFDRLGIQEIMRMIARWYNVEVIYKGEAPTSTFWGSISRFENVSKVLNALERTGNVHFEMKDRKIYVSR